MSRSLQYSTNIAQEKHFLNNLRNIDLNSLNYSRPHLLFP